MEITVGHTPDADDAFMFYGIVSGKVTIDNLKINHVIEDIESLNRRGVRSELDVTAVSAHGYAYTHDYLILHLYPVHQDLVAVYSCLHTSNLARHR